MREKRGIKLLYFYAAAFFGMAAAIVAIMGTSAMLYAGILGVLILLLYIGARLGNRQALSRAVGLGEVRDIVFYTFITLCMVGTTLLSVLDVRVLKITSLPALLMLLGLAILIGAYFVLFQCLGTHGRHGQEKYGEKPPEKQTGRGPYDVVRHPFMTALVLVFLALPLLFASGLGYAVAVPGMAAVLIRAGLEDDWRYQHYSWYIDYTKAVTYKVIPFIW